jgi:hypothetical protein
MLVGGSFRSHCPTIHPMLNNPSLKVANSIGPWFSKTQIFKVFFGYSKSLFTCKQILQNKAKT